MAKILPVALKVLKEIFEIRLQVLCITVFTILRLNITTIRMFEKEARRGMDRMLAAIYL